MIIMEKLSITHNLERYIPMKKIRTNVVALVALAAVLLTTSAVMAGMPKTKADCHAVAAKYEKLAADQEAVVKEHAEMKKDYRSNQASLPKQTREKDIAEMEKHCDAIIALAQKLADEYKAMAQWHKIHAAEMM